MEPSGYAVSSDRGVGHGFNAGQFGVGHVPCGAEFRQEFSHFAEDRPPWDCGLKACKIFKGLCDHGRQSVRRMALRTGLSKSSVPRLTQAMERRGVHPESGLWAT